MQLLGNLDIPKKQNSSGDVQPEYMDFYNSLRMVNDQGPQTIAKLVYTEANEGLLQISQTTRRNFYRPHNQHKFMVSPQRNVNFDAKKGVSELEGLTFPSTRPQRFFSSRGSKSNQDSCLMYAAVVFNNSRGFSQRHWNDLTYRNILRFTFMEPFVEGILFGTESLANFHQLSIPPVCTQTVFRLPTFFFTHQTPRLWLHCLSNKPFCLDIFYKLGSHLSKSKNEDLMHSLC